MYTAKITKLDRRNTFVVEPPTGCAPYIRKLLGFGRPKRPDVESLALASRKQAKIPVAVVRRPLKREREEAPEVVAEDSRFIELGSDQPVDGTLQMFISFYLLLGISFNGLYVRSKPRRLKSSKAIRYLGIICSVFCTTTVWYKVYQIISHQNHGLQQKELYAWSSLACAIVSCIETVVSIWSIQLTGDQIIRTVCRFQSVGWEEKRNPVICVIALTQIAVCIFAVAFESAIPVALRETNGLKTYHLIINCFSNAIYFKLIQWLPIMLMVYICYTFGEIFKRLKQNMGNTVSRSLISSSRIIVASIRTEIQSINSKLSLALLFNALSSLFVGVHSLYSYIDQNIYRGLLLSSKLLLLWRFIDQLARVALILFMASSLEEEAQQFMASMDGIDLQTVTPETAREALYFVSVGRNAPPFTAGLVTIKKTVILGVLCVVIVICFSVVSQLS